MGLGHVLWVVLYDLNNLASPGLGVVSILLE